MAKKVVVATVTVTAWKIRDTEIPQSVADRYIAQKWTAADGFRLEVVDSEEETFTGWTRQLKAQKWARATAAYYESDTRKTEIRYKEVTV